MEPGNDRLEILADKLEINELLTRYLRAVDRGDLDELAKCYLDGAREEHGGVFSGYASDYLNSIRGTLQNPRARTFHILSNVLVEISGTEALVESYVTAYARVNSETDRLATFTGARIIDRLRKVEGRWGIWVRQLVWEWNQDAKLNEAWLGGALIDDPRSLVRGRKFPDDLVYLESL